jgi:hypothetical protein
MIKNSRVEVGITPSSLSGQKSARVVAGEPVTKAEALRRDELALPEIPLELKKKSS